jgi:hypothetical protein
VVKGLEIMSLIGLETPHHHAFCSFSVYNAEKLSSLDGIDLYLCTTWPAKM